MSVDTTVARARRAARRLMVDIVSVERVTEGAFNPATGEYTQSVELLYAGDCRIKASWDFVEKLAGDAEQRANRPALCIPYEADDSGFRAGDRVTVTGDGAGVYTIVGELRQSSTRSFKAWIVESVEADV